MIELRLPYPPSANKLWRRSGKTIHKSDEYTDWLRKAGWHVMQQRQGGVSGPYKISVQAVRPDKRKRDLDNLIKPISDLLKSVGTVDDDSLCEMLSMRWVTAGEGVTVRVERAAIEESEAPDTWQSLASITNRIFAGVKP